MICLMRSNSLTPRNNVLKLSFIPIPAVASLPLPSLVLPSEAGRARRHLRVIFLIDLIQLVLGVGDMKVFLESESNIC
jgi:hypothetical protein